MKTALILFVVGLLSIPAFAQQDGEVEVRYRKVTALDFTDAPIKGALKGPQGTWVKSKRKTRFRSLIELRSSFGPELERSAGAM